MEQNLTLTKEQRDLVLAAFEDAKQTWPSVTLDFMLTQAKRILSGQNPQGGPGVFLEQAFRKAGWL